MRPWRHGPDESAGRASRRPGGVGGRRHPWSDEGDRGGLGRAGAVVHVTGRTARGAPSPMGRPETVEDTAGRRSRRSGARPTPIGWITPTSPRSRPSSTTCPHGTTDVSTSSSTASGAVTRSPTGSTRSGTSPSRSGSGCWHRPSTPTSSPASPRLAVGGQRPGPSSGSTDGKAGDPYRGTLYYDLAKDAVTRFALGMAGDLRPHHVAAVALAPGFLRSEAMLDRFGVTEATWRDGIAANRCSPSPSRRCSWPGPPWHWPPTPT